MKRTVFSSRVITRPLLQGILLLSVSLFSGQLWAISVSPSTSYNGSFTVSWASANALGCHGVGWGYNCRALQRKIGSGAWTTINTNQGYTSVAYSGYGVATHQYRIYNTTWSYVQDGPVTLQIKNATTPGTPSGPSTSATGSYTITSGVSTGAVRYQIQRRLSGGSWSTYNNGSSRSKAFSQGNGTWQYRSRGCGKTNYTYCSGWSGIRTVNVAITPGVPSSASISPTTSYNGSHTVSWGASSGSITSYQLYRSYNGGSYTHMYTGTATSRSYSSLAVGTYRYRVRAYKTTSSYTSYSGYRYTSTRNVSVPGTPGVPSGPASDADGAYTVSWGAGTGASTYELQERVNSGSWSTVQNTSATSRAVSGKGDGTWTYQVRACSATGCSGWSSTSANIIVALTPGVPASLSASPTSSTNGSHTVSWGAASGTVTAYQLERDIDGGGYSQTYSGTALSQPYTGLADGSYTYRIRACNTVSTVTHCSAYQSTSAVSVLNNQFPVAVADSDTTTEDISVVVDVLGNDTDADLDSLSVSSVTQGSNGSVTNNTNNVTYTPNANYHGTDNFTYTVSDGQGGTDTATVTITIDSENDAPVGNNDSDNTNEDTQVTVDVLGNDSDVDGDSLSIVAVTQGANGTVTNNGNNISYNPNTNYHGTDNFTYTVSDGQTPALTDTATVTITVGSINDAPVAVDDNDTIIEETTTVFDVLANDSDIDLDSLSVSSVTQGANGSVTNNTTNVSYTPALNFTGNDSFTYTVSDGELSDTATVNVTVINENDGPTIGVNSPLTVAEGATEAITSAHLLGNDPDDAPAGLTYTVTTPPQHGQLEFSDAVGVAITSYTQADIDANRVVYVHDGSDPAGTGVFPIEIELSSLDGSNGFVIQGVELGKQDGLVMTAAGDINGDGIADAIMGAPTADPNGLTDAGSSYVIFGNGSGFSTPFDLTTLDGTNGFVINGVAAGDQSGYAVSAAGDVNGDGIDDLIIGAPYADPNGNADAGESYVVFGQSGGFSATFELSFLDGTNGFVLSGIDAGDQSGYSVAGIGDMNQDGLGDVLIGAPYADPNDITDAGESYVALGNNSGILSLLDLALLDGSNGFFINGVSQSDRSGNSVSLVQDINGDGTKDFAIGKFQTTSSYVLFGGYGLFVEDYFEFDLADGGEDGASSISGTFEIGIPVEGN